MEFQPTMLGQEIIFHGEPGIGMITDEDETMIFIEHPMFTGWMLKTEYYEMLGIEE